jgi:hypothetical protein
MSSSAFSLGGERKGTNCITIHEYRYETMFSTKYLDKMLPGSQNRIRKWANEGREWPQR